MLKTIPHLLEQHGGTERHAVWIDLFTAPCKLVESEALEQTPVDNILKDFQYKPTATRAVRKEIEKSHNREELEANLANLFQFEKIKIVNFLVLSKIACEKEGQTQSKNLTIIPDFILRGFVALSYRMKEAVAIYSAGETSQSFPKECWQILHFPIVYLLHNDEKVLEKFVKVVDKFFEAFSDFAALFGPKSDESLKRSFVTILSSVIPYFNSDFELGSMKLLDFILAAFRGVSHQIGTGDIDNELFEIWHGFMQILNPYVPTLDIDRTEELVAATMTFVQKVDLISPQFEIKSFSFCMDNIALLHKVSHVLDADITVEIVRGVVALAKWVMKEHPVADELGDIHQERVTKRSLRWSNCESYFQTNDLLPDPKLQRFKNKYLVELVEKIRGFFVHAPQLGDGLLEGIADVLCHVSSEEKLNLCSIFCCALIGAQSVPVSDFLQAFLFSIILSGPFPSSIEVASPFASWFREMALCMMYSICCISKDVCLFVLTTILSVSDGDDYMRLHYFMPLFRSLLLIDSRTNFVECFFESGIVDSLKWLVTTTNENGLLDELAQLYQVMILFRPMKVFSHITFLPMLREMTKNPRLQAMMGPCFKVGMSLSQTPPVEDGRKATYMTFEQVLIIFKQCATEENLIDLSLCLVSYMSQSMEVFDPEVISYLEELGVFDGVVSLPGIAKTQKSVLIVLNLFTKICGRFPKFRASLATVNAELLKQLEQNIQTVPLDATIVDALTKFMFGNHERAVIVNRSALRLLLRIVEGTEFEEMVLKNLHSLCTTNIANAYACFSCDVVRFLMSKITDDRLTSIGIPLFKVICSSFFSPLTMRETMKAMRLTDSGKRLPKHRALIDCFVELLQDKSHTPVSAFYHFTGNRTGIYGPVLDAALFNQPFAIATAFKQEDNISRFSPVISFYEKPGNNFVAAVQDGQLTIKQTIQDKTVAFQAVPQFLHANSWYVVMLVFHQDFVDCYIDGKSCAHVEVTKMEYEGKVGLMLGTFDNQYFVGNIGPTLFMRSTDPDQIAVRYSQVNAARSDMKCAFIKFLPWCLERGEVCDVTENGDRARLTGSAIPFCSTVAEVLSYDLSFERFLPLLLYVNHKEEGSEDEENDIHFFVSVLRLILCLLEISSAMKEKFSEVGGFQLLAGFLSQIDVHKFTIPVQNELRCIFEELGVESLRSQMCEFIWMNFDLWSKMSYDFQLTMYTKTLIVLWAEDRKTEYNSFKFSSLDFLLYAIQLSMKNDERMNSKLSLFPYENSEILSADNPGFELSDTQISELQESQWNLFNRLIIGNDSPSLFMMTLMLAYGHQDQHIRVLALDLIHSYLVQLNRNAVIALEMVNGYRFLLQISMQNPVIDLKNVMDMMFVLANQEKEGKFNPSTMKRLPTVSGLAMRLCNEDWSKEEHLPIESCFAQTLDKAGARDQVFPFKHSEFIAFVAALSHYAEKDVLRKLVNEMSQTIRRYPETIVPFTDVVGWPIWLLRLLGNALDLPQEMDFLCEIVARILFELFKEVQLTSVLRFFLNTYLVEVALRADLHILRCRVLLILIKRLEIERLEKEAHEKLLSIAVVHLFFRFQCEIPLEKGLEDFGHMDLGFERLSTMSQAAWESLCKTFDITTEKKLDEQGNWEDLDLAVETLRFVRSLPHDSSLPLFLSRIEMPVSDVISILEAQISNENNSSLTHLREQAETYKTESLPNVLTEAEKFSGSLLALLSSCDKTDKQYRESLDGFQKCHGKTRILVSLHNHKLMTSFMREVTSNGGPWVLAYKAVKWRCTTKLDGQGRNIYMSINRRFDDHRKASALRDSLELKQGDEEAITEVVSFKRMVDQKTTFIPVSAERMKAAATFRAKYYTLTKQYSGLLHVTQKAIVFDGKEDADSFGNPLDSETCAVKFFEIPFARVGFIFTRSYLHEDIGCEIFANTRKTYSLTLSSREKRDEFLGAVKKNTEKLNMRTIRLLALFQRACGCCVQTMPSSELLVKSQITEYWQRRRISNFEYLFYLNILSGRSFNDLTQYPVYPWVLSDYVSETINLQDPSVYRDLTKPIGALNPKRLMQLENIERDMEDWTQKCLYRTHYSNPAAVIGFLIRTEPFSTLHIKLQDDKYDHPDRLFYSIAKAWKSVNGKNLDFRELTPEFFCSPHFLTNENGFDLGSVDDRSIGEVLLPKWAKNPSEFVAINRQALESEYVSTHLSSWIDLMFGVHQLSHERRNVFHPFTYPEIVSSGQFPSTLVMLAKHHSANFGMCPARLFNFPHPKRNSSRPPVFDMKPYPDIGPIIAANGEFMLSAESVLIDLSQRATTSLAFKWKYSKDTLCVMSRTHILTTGYDGTTVHVFDIKANSELGVLPQKSSIINCMESIDDTYLLTGGSDCAIYLWRVPTLECIAKIALHSMPIVAIDGENSLGIMVSIDEGHNVYYTSLLTRHAFHMFTLQWPKRTSHHVKIFRSGMIAISSHVTGEEESTIELFDMCGGHIERLKVLGAIACMVPIETSDYCEYLAVTTSSRWAFLINCSKQTIDKKFDIPVVPDFLGYTGGRRLVLVLKKSEREQLVPVEF